MSTIGIVRFPGRKRFGRRYGIEDCMWFGAGMGRKEEVCGAVTGGIIVIGTRYGRGENDDRTAQEETYAKTRELMNQFAKRHGTFICRKLLNGCELTTVEGQKYFKENDLLNKTCVPCVQSVVDILENIM